jgi:SET domain-containing protein
LYKEYLITKLIPGKGQGIFTTVEISAGQPILEITGPVILEKNLPDPNHPALLQVGPDLFIGASGDLDDLINHSCNPNCYMQIAGIRAILFSLYVIPVGSELTFDYSSTSTDSLDKWKMECHCGQAECRKIISGFDNLPSSIQQKMIEQGIVPMYLLHPEMFPSSW